MRLAVSNIAWAPERLGDVLPDLQASGVEGLVIAPTMVFGGEYPVSANSAERFRKDVEEAGLAIAGLQSLTFGLEGAALSGGLAARQTMTEHLKRQAELGGKLGASSLIFGSPGMRKGVQRDEAVGIFRKVAETAADNGTRLCIEPLSGYGNEFVKTTQEGVTLVREVDHSGFGLHLDSAAIAGADTVDFGDIESAHQSVGITSFDASAGELAPISTDLSVDHRAMAAALKRAAFSGFVSLEMRQPQAEDPVAALFNEIAYAREQYGL